MGLSVRRPPPRQEHRPLRGPQDGGLALGVLLGWSSQIAPRVGASIRTIRLRNSGWARRRFAYQSSPPATRPNYHDAPGPHTSANTQGESLSTTCG